MPVIHLVIPCYNEAERLPQEAFVEFAIANDVQFIFVNDGSRDETLAVLQALCRRMPDRMDWLDLPQNQGKAEAVRQGFLKALEHGAEFIGFWDADLATPLDSVRDYMAVFDEKPGLEMVFGSRVKLLGWDIERAKSRHYSGRVFATVVSTILRMPIYDTQCGSKIFKVTEGTPVVFGEPFLSRWVFDVEILAREQQRRWESPELPRIEEVLFEMPLRAWRDVAGSKLKLRDFFWAMRDVWKIYRRYLRKSIWRRRKPDAAQARTSSGA